MKPHLKILIYGFLAWLIPFIISIFFYTADGTLRTDIFFFKSIMIVVGTASASYLLILYFKTIHRNVIKEGIIVGLIWFAINILLDLIILLPMSGMPINDYVVQIGIRYLAMPIISTTIGIALANKQQQS
ncbi:hypothetical protein KC726_03835 [Candidatus Woesebacteria bacterium]|nr:hypothetical protein [Candidatus Woesebacteria bacterium]